MAESARQRPYATFFAAALLATLASGLLLSLPLVLLPRATSTATEARAA